MGAGSWAGLLIAAAGAGESAAADRFAVQASLGVNAYQMLAGTGAAPAAHLSPADRVLLYQSIGVGYHLHRNIRAQVNFQFGETLNNVRPGTSHLTLGGVAPGVVFVDHGFFAGGGALFLARSAGKDQFDMGVVASAGYVHAIGNGLSMGASLQAPVLLHVRRSISLVPAWITSWHF